jgi:hypothetical protein
MMPPALPSGTSDESMSATISVAHSGFVAETQASYPSTSVNGSSMEHSSHPSPTANLPEFGSQAHHHLPPVADTSSINLDCLRISEHQGQGTQVHQPHPIAYPSTINHDYYRSSEIQGQVTTQAHHPHPIANTLAVNHDYSRISVPQDQGTRVHQPHPIADTSTVNHDYARTSELQSQGTSEMDFDNGVSRQHFRDASTRSIMDIDVEMDGPQRPAGHALTGQLPSYQIQPPFNISAFSVHQHVSPLPDREPNQPVQFYHSTNDNQGPQSQSNPGLLLNQNQLNPPFFSTSSNEHGNVVSIFVLPTELWN